MRKIGQDVRVRNRTQKKAQIEQMKISKLNGKFPKLVDDLKTLQDAMLEMQQKVRKRDFCIREVALSITQQANVMQTIEERMESFDSALRPLERALKSKSEKSKKIVAVNLQKLSHRVEEVKSTKGADILDCVRQEEQEERQKGRPLGKEDVCSTKKFNGKMTSCPPIGDNGTQKVYLSSTKSSLPLGQKSLSTKSTFCSRPVTRQSCNVPPQIGVSEKPIRFTLFPANDQIPVSRVTKELISTSVSSPTVQTSRNNFFRTPTRSSFRSSWQVNSSSLRPRTNSPLLGFPQKLHCRNESTSESDLVKSKLPVKHSCFSRRDPAHAPLRRVATPMMPVLERKFVASGRFTRATRNRGSSLCAADRPDARRPITRSNSSNSILRRPSHKPIHRSTSGAHPPSAILQSGLPFGNQRRIYLPSSSRVQVRAAILQTLRKICSYYSGEFSTPSLCEKASVGVQHPLPIGENSPSDIVASAKLLQLPESPEASATAASKPDSLSQQSQPNRLKSDSLCVSSYGSKDKDAEPGALADGCQKPRARRRPTTRGGLEGPPPRPPQPPRLRKPPSRRPVRCAPANPERAIAISQSPQGKGAGWGPACLRCSYTPMRFYAQATRPVAIRRPTSRTFYWNNAARLRYSHCSLRGHTPDEGQPHGDQPPPATERPDILPPTLRTEGFSRTHSLCADDSVRSSQTPYESPSASEVRIGVVRSAFPCCSFPLKRFFSPLLGGGPGEAFPQSDTGTDIRSSSALRRRQDDISLPFDDAAPWARSLSALSKNATALEPAQTDSQESLQYDDSLHRSVHSFYVNSNCSLCQSHTLIQDSSSCATNIPETNTRQIVPHTSSERSKLSDPAELMRSSSEHKAGAREEPEGVGGSGAEEFESHYGSHPPAQCEPPGSWAGAGGRPRLPPPPRRSASCPGISFARCPLKESARRPPRVALVCAPPPAPCACACACPAHRHEHACFRAPPRDPPHAAPSQACVDAQEEAATAPAPCRKCLAFMGSLLLAAAHKGRAQDVEALLGLGARVNHCNALKWTPLHRAAAKGHPEVASLLVSRGADVNARTAYGWTALHLAALADRSGRCVALLAAAEGARVDARSRAGRTPLHDAARCGHLAAAHALVRAGASVGARDDEGRTPLDVAKTEAVRRFLAKQLHAPPKGNDCDAPPDAPIRAPVADLGKALPPQVFF